ncbi:MAG TPA: MtnX-like HAD-IB family phosphatase [Ignavibacteriaceae bacterium]|jgi:2,3-diketo-5-methylthio-1-phosphopentane phosphatase|nr:MAG: 2-hydroxy-3-keto-5-methylthiopentenyl-1-phosphate phosphatase [Ignavibacteria bacterium ADurb.Bin266]OQY74059.1 MAG: 2-hydroxy-3-keto-5-methylthiopentenyl-1-phosphate phosphatase [Ignavibacteriales bacterium UTCHB2]HQF42298.1 MtnX-like HAD-IB family phosphatase [Ignavibacteriaceae bacterium]HQI40888.1 MtnX-like HAD-IB family phosphatase [Ignavibacteriaceae bacterium]HQJ45227.1 MtnX-like HAD-IB family phosphatase [Ignavibacteriaceae bacterium]
MKKREIKIFVDFDGTITLQDIGEAIFNKFGDAQRVDKIITNLLEDRISSKQCWDELCDCAGAVNPDELVDFVNTMEIDQSFISFNEFCSENNLEIIVLSDGFDFYIDKMFVKYKLEGLKYYSNNLKVEVNGRLSAGYPHYDADSPTSANCKRNHIINHSSDEDYTVYIGDGNSDKEAAQYCDFIFAKKDLARFCSMERISFYPFNDFNDVQNKLVELMNKKNLRKRHQAQLKRRSAYLAE